MARVSVSVSVVLVMSNVLLALAACGDSTASSDTAATSITTLNPSAGSMTGASATGTDSGMSATGSGSASEPTDSGASATDSSASVTDSGVSATSSTATTDDPTGFKFDMPAGDFGDTGVPGDCDCGNADWSYVFIANTGEATISKINTRTLTEEGRYRTGGSSPSRTSVSVDGRAVVVANRHTGIAKYWTKPEFCDEMQNGQPGLQTSMNNQPLPFGEDDCLAWFTPFPNMTVQRPVQWTAGEGECHLNQKVWTTTGSMGSGPGQCGKSGVWVHLLDGESGAIDETIHIPDNEFNCDHTNTDLGLGLGPYGGAVDFDGNFWFHGFGNGKLVRVDYASHDYEIFSGGGYGITVDTKGRVWLSSSMSRFDYKTKQKQSANVSTSGGIAQDLQGRMWAAGQNGVVFVDMETLAVGQNIALPVNNQVKGVSVDIDGYIWAVAQGDTRAFKIDPNDFTFEIFTGLNDPYTYSDMTGGAVYNISCNPPPE